MRILDEFWIDFVLFCFINCDRSTDGKPKFLGQVICYWCKENRKSWHDVDVEGDDNCDLLFDSQWVWEGWKETNNDEAKPHLSFKWRRSERFLAEKGNWGNNHRLTKDAFGLHLFVNLRTSTLGQCTQRDIRVNIFIVTCTLINFFLGILLCLFVWGKKLNF